MLQRKTRRSFNFLLIALSSAVLAGTGVAWFSAPTLSQTQNSADERAARQALITDMSKPAATVQNARGVGSVTAIALESPYAIAKWEWGPTGGLAVLVKRPQGWQVVTRRSDWPGVAGFQKLGIPNAVATCLLDRLYPDSNWRSW